jgi:3-oxoacyl-[acyl-carrier-protein] synthase-1
MPTVSGSIDYVNTHGTSTPVGDSARRWARSATVFGENMPHISSTKSLTGHSLGAAGVQESIYSILMMQGGFIGESAHIENLDPEFEGMPIVRKRIDNARIDTGAVELLRLRRNECNAGLPAPQHDRHDAWAL